MAMSYIPGNSVEFETLTTEPAYGDPKEFDTNPYADNEGNKRAAPQYVRILGHHTRDDRLGNISHRIDDLEYLEDRKALVSAFLYPRGGEFSDCAVLAEKEVSSTLQLSQSRGGFFRKNARTFTQVGENYDNAAAGGFMARLFGGSKRKNGGM